MEQRRVVKNTYKATIGGAIRFIAPKQLIMTKIFSDSSIFSPILSICTIKAMLIIKGGKKSLKERRIL